MFDFWSVFCSGIVSLTSYMAVYEKGAFASESEELPLFVYIVIAYVIGLILHSLSSALIDCKVLKLRTEQISTEGYKEKRPFLKYYNQYWANNDLIDSETKSIGFKKCYNYLKHYGNMSRNLALWHVFNVIRHR